MKVDLIFFSDICNEVDNKLIEVVISISKTPHIETDIRTNESSLVYSENLKACSKFIKSEFIGVVSELHTVSLFKESLERMVDVINNSAAAMVYSDYLLWDNGSTQYIPTVDYQMGSLRDTFDFGAIQLYKRSVFQQWAESTSAEEAGELYDLRLFASRKGYIKRIPEALFTCSEKSVEEGIEKQFRYVQNSELERQSILEKICLKHLNEIKALSGVKEKVDLHNVAFEFEVSVVIPVKNRVKTIGEAITSAMNQNTKFKFNVIVVDNYSTDGTTELIQSLSDKFDNLIHLIPARMDLGIGGCWNEAIQHSKAGKFIVQLDSDDLYNSDKVLQTIVNTFYENNCAMVIGSYELVDFNLEPIPPGLISHNEWNDLTGADNALRINGLGAPRAFYTPVLKETPFPNTSYGEDYAVVLAISGKYNVARIYESLYLCRRWGGNSDSDLNVERENVNNFYKDWLRTNEINKRIQRNKLKGNERIK